MNKIINSQMPKGWDNTADLLKQILNPKNNSIGFSTLFAIDALNLAIEKEREQDDMIVLDIAAGTGVLDFYGATKYKNAKFIATDFSQSMVSIIDTFIKELNAKNIESKVMDGQNLQEIQDSTIDYTFSIFGLIFFPDVAKGIKEMYRVLKPGGKTAIGSWCNNAFLIKVFQGTMDELLGQVGKYKQVALSLSDSSVFENKLKDAGFKNIQITQVQHPMEINEFTDLIKMFNVNPVYHDCIAELPDDKKPLFDETFLKIANQNHDQKRNENGKLELKSYSYIGIGQK